MMFTSPLPPPVFGHQEPEDWPELPASVVHQFNHWAEPETQAEMARRVARGHADGDCALWFLDRLYAAAQMELVKYARKYRGESVSVDLYGWCGGMTLPLIR